MKCDILFDSSNYGAEYVRKYFDETAVEICKSYKCLDVSNTRKGLLIPNNFNFPGVYADTFGRNDQSEVTNFGDVEFIFVDVCLQPCLLKSCKDFSYVGLMFFLGVTIDQNVVNVGDAKFV